MRNSQEQVRELRGRVAELERENHKLCEELESCQDTLKRAVNGTDPELTQVLLAPMVGKLIVDYLEVLEDNPNMIDAGIAQLLRLKEKLLNR